MACKKTTLLFGGDYVLNNYNYCIDAEINKLFQEADYRFLNLEAPILTRNKYKKTVKAGLHLQASEQAIQVLKELKITHLCGANNHIMDYGYEGYEETEKILNNNNIIIKGCGMSVSEAMKVIDIDNNIKIICTCEEEFNIAEKEKPGCFSMYDNKIINIINTLKQQNKFIIVYAHGGNEMVPLPSQYIFKRYHDFIDAGADAIIGHHPHNIQGMELYQNKIIVYSLGNFIHYLYPKSTGMLFRLEITNNVIVNSSFSTIKLTNNKLSQECNNKENINYFKTISNFFCDKGLLNSLWQEQAIYLFTNVYKKYFINAVNKPRNIFGKISAFFLQQKKIQKEGEIINFPLLMHLFRNNSHQATIETALKIITKETQDFRTEKTHNLFNNLIRHIYNE